MSIIKGKERKVIMLPVILAIQDENDRNFVSEEYLRYSTRLKAVAEKYLYDSSHAEDCVQDVVIKLADYLQKYQLWDEKHRFNFLVKCCRCIAINKYKDDRKRYSHECGFNYSNDDKDFDVIDEDAYVDRLVISDENQKRLCKIIEEMDPIYGDILYLKGFLDMKNTEIAEMLDISVDLVNVRLMRARRLLLTTRSEEIDDILRK